MKQASLVLGICLCATGIAFAQFKPAHIPETATWFAQLDAKALRVSAVAGLVPQLLDDAAMQQVAAVQSLTGVSLANDIDTAVLFGKGNVPTNAVLALYGRFNVNRMTTVLSMASEFENRALGTLNLLSWIDNGQRNHLCFLDPTHVVFSRDGDEAVAAVKQITDPAAANPAAAQTLTPLPNRFFALQVNQVKDFLADNQQLTMLLNSTDSLTLDLGTRPDDGGIDATLALAVNTPEQATQLHQILLGLQALLMMQAKDNPDTAALAQQVKVSLDGQRINMRVSLSRQDLQQLIDAQVAKRQPPAPEIK